MGAVASTLTASLTHLQLRQKGRRTSLAGAIPGPSLTLDQVAALVRATRDGESLPALHFYGAETEVGGAFRAVVHVVRVRDAGFMAVFPRVEKVDAYPSSAEQSEVYATTPARVVLEALQSRDLGEHDVWLVDVPTAALPSFRTPSRTVRQPELLKFQGGRVTARPQKASTLAAAEQWIGENMDEDTAAEYGTAASMEDLEVLDGEPEPSIAAPEHVAQLREEIRRLRNLVEGQARNTAAPARDGGVLGAVPRTAPSGDNLARLRALAGPAPARIGQLERNSRAQGQVAPHETVQQELALEAVDGEELNDLDLLGEEVARDPMQRMLVMQMKQLQLLSRHVIGKPQDPIHAALGSSGGGDGSSSSTSGIKGCLAREAYVKMASNLVMMAQTVEQNAQQELGVTTNHPGLLRHYLEKRAPLGNMKLLTQMGYYLANAWEVGALTGNRELQGFAGRGMLFIEQTALDSGRTGPSTRVAQV